MTDEAGAEGGEVGQATAATPTADGTGGKVPFMTEGGSGGAGGEGGEGATKQEGSQTVDIKALLGEDMAADRNIAKFLDTENPVQEMAKSLLEAQKAVGSKRAGVPPEDASPEDKAAFFKELGVPEDAKDYELKKPEGWPEEAYDQKNADKWSAKFKELNVPKATAHALRDAIFEDARERAAAASKTLTEAMERDFGSNRMTVAKEIGDLMTKAIPDTGLRQTINEAISDEKNPAFALAMGHALQYMKKTYGMADNNINQGDGETAGQTISSMREKAVALQSTEAFNNGLHKDHESTVAEVNTLYKDIASLTASQKKR